MKFLTLVQPWASLIAEGHKWIETRGYSTKYRGPLAIHAGKAKHPKCDRCSGHGIVRSGEYDVDCCPECGGSGRLELGCDVLDLDAIPRGVVLAVCDLVDVVPIKSVNGSTSDRVTHVTEARHAPGRFILARPGSAMHTTGRLVGEHFEWQTEDISDQAPFGDFTPGRHAWLLSNVRPIEPVPMKGALGIQDVPGDALTQILAQILP